MKSISIQAVTSFALLIQVQVVVFQRPASAFSASSRRIKPAPPQAPVADVASTTTTTTTTRRNLVFQLAVSSSSSLVALLLPLNNNKAQAVGEGSERMVLKQKPTAPIGALIPAIQQRLLLEAVIALVESKQQQSEEWDKPKVQSILLRWDDDNNNDYSDAKIFKKYDPAHVLKGDLTRAAMNLHQTNLSYDNLYNNNNNNPNAAFTITDPDWKKSYIRANDGLPDLKRVIGADLDMRQLLRNKVQQQLDDASAELYAQECDRQELLLLLREAAQSFDMWLDRARDGDVRDAVEAAVRGEKVVMYDSFAAGFVPGRAKER